MTERTIGRIAVAVSGAGSNLQALHAAAERGELGGTIVLVVAAHECENFGEAAGRTAVEPSGSAVEWNFKTGTVHVVLPSN